MLQTPSPSERPDIEGATPGFSPVNLIAAFVVIAALYLGREVLVPVVFAIILSFALAIPAGAIQKWGLGRKLPVAIVVCVAFLAIAAIGTIVSSQTAELAGELPRYQNTIREKLNSLRASTGGGPFDRLITMGEDLSKEISSKEGPGKLAPGQATAQKPIPVEVTEPSTPMKTLANIVVPVLKPLATAGLVIVFTVFMLLQRTDLRNRAIRLSGGSRDLQRTTAAMNDAATRLSKYFLVQVLLNAGFGVFVGIGLWLLGIPSPVLWGILAAISKFIPYFGVVIAAGGPLVLAAAVDPTWSTFLITAGFFAVSEFLVGQVIEPLVYGHSTGLSPVAVILSVTFWTWLWGPVGLILATPLTVCLVVLGRHVDQLRFLYVMLSDRPPLNFAENFYQRALAGDASEAIDQADEFLKSHRLATFYDEVAVRSLTLAQADLSRGALDETRLDRVASTMSALIEDLAEHDESAPPTEWTPGASGDDEDALRLALLQADREAGLLPDLRAGEGATPVPARSVICVASRTELDRIGAEMLAQILARNGLPVQVESAHALSAAGGDRIDRSGAGIVCLSALDARSPAHLRYAVRRVRRRLPQAKVLVGIWGLDTKAQKALCDAVKADLCTGRLTEAARICLDEATSQETLAVEEERAPPARVSDAARHASGA